MPQATDITVKNSANVDKTFTLINPSAGDDAIALWLLKEGLIPGAFPRLTTSARGQGDGSRRFQAKLSIPTVYTDVATGRVTTLPGAEMNFSTRLSAEFPQANKADFVAYTSNIIALALMKAAYGDGYPMT